MRHQTTRHLLMLVKYTVALTDVIYVRVGRGLAAFALSRVAGHFDQTLETGLVQAVTGRLAAGLNRAP